MKLLADDSVVRVDGANDGRSKECEALNRNVVEQEDSGSAKSNRGEDAFEDLLAVELVEDFGGSDSLGLDTGNRQVFFFLRKPFGGCWSVGHSDEANERQADSN